MKRMKKVLLRLRNLSWKWWLLIIVLVIVFIVFVATPAYIYYSRDRKPHNYTDIPAVAESSYQVTYDSGSGEIDQSRRILKMVDSAVVKNGTTCFHVVTIYDEYPKRKVNAPIVNETTIESGEDEIWRSRGDYRMIFKKILKMNLPLVNTVVNEITYSNYEGYPGWPYHLHDKWTYEALYRVDVSFISDWTDFYQVEVIDDAALVEINGIQSPCFKVVHTLIDTTNSTPSGGGIGAEMIEYWYNDRKWILPIKTEDWISYKGVEISVMTGRMPPG